MGNAAFWILSTPIFGRIIDEYELKTGNRPIGTFNGINAIFITPNKQIMIFLFTLIISSMGYRGEAIIQTEQAVFGIQIAVAYVPMILLSMGFLILLYFPLSGEKLEEVKKEIKEDCGIITICRPDVLNALNTETVITLKNILRDLRNNKDVGVVILKHCFKMPAYRFSLPVRVSSKQHRFALAGSLLQIDYNLLPYWNDFVFWFETSLDIHSHFLFG